MTDVRHEPVLVSEVVSLLTPERGGLFIDCTAGLGGHSAALLDRGASRLVGIDRDDQALCLARERLLAYGDRVQLVHADYREIGRVLDDRGITAVDGILADLGVSSVQLDAADRGFSFRRDEPLDMRMDQSQGPTAADLIAGVDETALANVIFEFGEERHSRRVARSIVHARSIGRIETTGSLADIVRRAVPTRGYQRIDPATRTFQALRIWVNRELEGLDAFLGEATRRLRAGGRLAVISFHSLEDRIVKHTFRALTAASDALQVLTRKPVVAGDDELARNPRARSAKLRAIERLA
ncbi:MAG TPA: 16S rRNA (cytosine(1402)-N(4))-methyltransferase RsmH [Vicinamibacterales bacterium]|nr:16S rRNA (cytosine(1402)-N(4))-methyltransferase RsmH [Vicinamibacterales bacterium]